MIEHRVGLITLLYGVSKGYDHKRVLSIRILIDLAKMESVINAYILNSDVLTSLIDPHSKA